MHWALLLLALGQALVWKSTRDAMISTLSYQEMETLFAAVNLSHSGGILAHLLAYPAYDFRKAYRASCSHPRPTQDSLTWLLLNPESSLHYVGHPGEIREMLYDVGCVVKSEAGLFRTMVQVGWLPRYLLHAGVSDLHRMPNHELLLRMAAEQPQRVEDGRWCRSLKRELIAQCPWRLLTVDCLRQAGVIQARLMVQRLLREDAEGESLELAIRILHVYRRRHGLHLGFIQAKAMERWLREGMERLSERFNANQASLLQQVIFPNRLLSHKAHRLFSLLCLASLSTVTWAEMVQIALLLKAKPEWTRNLQAELDPTHLSTQLQIDLKMPPVKKQLAGQPWLIKRYLEAGMPKQELPLAWRLDCLLWHERISQHNPVTDLKEIDFLALFTGYPIPWLNTRVEGQPVSLTLSKLIVKLEPTLLTAKRTLRKSAKAYLLRRWAKARWHYWLTTGRGYPGGLAWDLFSQLHADMTIMPNIGKLTEGLAAICAEWALLGLYFTAAEAHGLFFPPPSSSSSTGEFTE